MQQDLQDGIDDDETAIAADEAFAYTGAERRRAPRSAMAKPQWAIPRVDFMMPEQVPTRAAILSALDPETLAACRRAATGSAAERQAALSALSALFAADAKARDCDPPAVILAGEAASPDVLDAFFRMRRLEHDHPAVYLHSILSTRGVLQSNLEDGQTTIGADELATIGHALLAALAIAIGEPVPPAQLDWTASTRPMTTSHAVRRWIQGHQIFAALTQVLVYAFETIEAASGMGDEQTMFEAADLAALTLRGCAASLRFTGDFPADVYESLIRVSMGSPFQPDGFSGLLSSDHRHLVRRMKATKPSLDVLRERDAARYDSIATALASVYEAHKFVCSRFVGTDRPSLIMVRDVGRSAVDNIERFKTTRLRAIGVEVAEHP